MVGFFSFLLLLCCESATASFRASLVPIHSTFGISTFVLAVAAACSGLTEKAFFSLRYVQSPKKWLAPASVLLWLQTIFSAPVLVKCGSFLYSY